MENYFNHKDINYSLYKKNFNEILKNQKKSHILRGGNIKNKKEIIQVLLKFNIDFNIKIKNIDLFKEIVSRYKLNNKKKLNKSSESFYEVTIPNHNNDNEVDKIIKYISLLDNDKFDITLGNDTKIGKKDDDFINFIIKQKGLFSKNYNINQNNNFYKMLMEKYNDLIKLNN